VRLVLLGHLSRFGGKRCCPVTVSRQPRTWTSCVLSRLVTGGSQITEICGWESCVLYHSIFLATPLLSPFPFSARVDKQVEGSGTVASYLTSLADCLWFSVYRSSASHGARPSSQAVLVQGHRASHCQTSRDVPREAGWEFYRTRLLAPPSPLSARAIISLGSTWKGSPQSAACYPAQDEQPSKKRWEEVDINGLIRQAPTSLSPRYDKRGTADGNTARHTSVVLNSWQGDQ
jgi:hypothetical protein